MWQEIANKVSITSMHTTIWRSDTQLEDVAFSARHSQILQFFAYTFDLFIPHSALDPNLPGIRAFRRFSG